MTTHADDQFDTRMMRLALDLARKGFCHTKTNPMVGAVITAPGGRIIGSGWHRIFGQAHAEVNAIASVKPDDLHLLSQSTVYVTLEPCAHYGKTPPCAKLLADKKIKRVVVATEDPFAKVDGRGIAIMRQAGIQVETGLLSHLSRRLNVQFMTAHTNRRPFVTLKWARTADGFIDRHRNTNESALRISTPATSALAQNLRAAHTAILVGSGTAISDRPRLDVRDNLFLSPQPIILDRRGRIDPADTSTTLKPVIVGDYKDIDSLLSQIYDMGHTSLLVEGGARVLASFIAAGAYDMVRTETSATTSGDGVKAPQLPENISLLSEKTVDGNIIRHYTANPLLTASHPLVSEC